ncbi:ABC transporter permease [Streptomyces hainanensis]|uniref:ABC transporter permease n=1 Tax=Streptomyces hainanensis TaxID=402648 RepID=A0A4R4SYH8_9ACTN|nr:ABC transporter permease [Streptomyces hainanensis]TDC69327.1 ABC transporter permease [Streptomyces hainanensis]
MTGATGATRWPRLTRGLGGRWRAFRRTPYFAAAVVSLLVAASAAAFAGCYTYALANPTPRHIPVAVVGHPPPADGPQPGGWEVPPGRCPQAQACDFVDALERGLGADLSIHRYADYPQAVDAVESQSVFAILRGQDRRVEMDVASAAGATVAELLTRQGPPAAKAAGVKIEVRDIKPLQSGDPRGLAVFYITIAAVIMGFLGTVQLAVNVPALRPAERVAFVVGYAALGALAIVAVVDWWLGALEMPVAQSWGILALTMFTSGMVYAMFNTLFGRWALLPTWGLMVMLGNPSSGGAVSWPLLPTALGVIGRWLPPGASVDAQHTAIYFPGHQHARPYLVLAGWALVSCVVFWILRDRRPGGRRGASNGATGKSPGGDDPRGSS